MQLLPVSSLPHPIEKNNKIIVKKNLKNASKILKKIKKDATKIRESHLHHCVDEAELEGNIVHSSFFCNLIAIEIQIKMHKSNKKVHFP